LPPECQILRLKCTKINFHWRSVPDPAGGTFSVPPNSLAGFKGPTSKGRKGKYWGMGGEKVGKGRKGEEK